MNVEGAGDAVDAADEAALVVDVDADYEDADFDFAEEPEPDVFCTETRTEDIHKFIYYTRTKIIFKSYVNLL